VRAESVRDPTLLPPLALLLPPMGKVLAA
jgi:hypothetical protein